MARAFRKEVLRAVGGSIGLFLAIVGIVALGCGFYAGLRMTSPDMRTFADAYYDGTRLHDLRVLCDLGLSNASIEQIRAVEGADHVMAQKSCDILADFQDEQFAMRVSTLPASAAGSTCDDGVNVESEDDDFLNRPILTEGRWPQAAGECVMSADRAMPHDIQMGEVVRVLGGTQDLGGVLACEEFTVVGLAHSPAYVSSAAMGSTQLGTGTIVQFLLVAEESFQADFPYTEAHVGIDAARAQFAGSEAYQAAVDEVASRIEGASGQIVEARLDDLRASTRDLAGQAGGMLVGDGEGADALSQMLLVLALGPGERAYNPRGQDTMEGVAAAADQLQEYRAYLDGTKTPELYVLDRTKNPGTESFASDAGRIDSIAAVFPFIFFLVAALVALTTMTRLVDEERQVIGTHKALGYSFGAIAGKYVFYAAAASIAGAVVGIAVLSQVLPYIICSAYDIIYNVPIPRLPPPVDWGLALLSAGMGCGITVLATLAAAMATLRETPAALMLPRAPKAGRRLLLERVRPLWRRLSFSWKVTCRNLFRYKKRLFMTVIGIAGCTALLLTGLGLHNSIWDIIDKHYGPVAHATLTVTLSQGAPEGDVQAVADALEASDLTSDVVVACLQNTRVGSAQAAATYSTEAIVARDGNLDAAFSLHDRATGAALSPAGGAVVSEKLASLLGVQAGDTVLVYDQDDIGNVVGEGTPVTVDGVAEYYIGNALFMERGLFEQVAGDAPEFRTLLAVATDDAAGQERLADELHAMPGVDTVTFNVETVERWRTMLNSVNMIVYVLVASAAALAFIVLYNLTNINITERRREIASLKVLGFTRGEVYTYIFREIALLAVAGALLGLALGVGMEGFVVATAEVDYVMFGRDIHATSFVLAFALTLVFTGLVMLAMRGKLRAIDMVESLKSVE